MGKRRRRGRSRAKKPLVPAPAAPMPSVSGNGAAHDCEAVPNPDCVPLSKLDADQYASERRTLIEISGKSAEQHDKAIIALSGGGLALSLTFLENIAPNPREDTLWLLGVAWLCFIASLFVVLLSFLFSQWACDRQHSIIDNLYAGWQAVEEEKNPFRTWTHRLNLASYVLFVGAVSFLAAFSWTNLARETDSMADQQRSQYIRTIAEPNKIKGGQVPPKAPVTTTTTTSLETKPKTPSRPKGE